MNINITPEDVDNVVKSAILKASLGEVIQKALSVTFSGYNNPVEKQLNAYVSELVNSLIREKFHEQIHAAVLAHVEKVVTEGLVNKTVDEAMRDIKRVAERYAD